MTAGPPDMAALNVLVPPSTPARIALWLGVLNSMGLMVLGAYCLKASVDHFNAAALAALLLALPSLVIGTRTIRR